MRIYFNPNLMPDPMYSYIKPMLLLFNKVYIWSPLVSQLLNSNFKAEDFIELCDYRENGEPILIPVARDHFFDKKMRSSHPDATFRSYYADFDDKIKQLSIRNQEILNVNFIRPSDDYAEGNKIIDTPWNNDGNRELIEDVIPRVITSLSAGRNNVIQELSAENKRPLAWNGANTFAQDILAASQINAYPFIPPDLLPGYLCLVDDTLSHFDSYQHIHKMKRQLQNHQTMPAMPVTLEDDDIKNFISTVFSIDRNTSVKDIIQLRKSNSNHELRYWIIEAARNKMPYDSLITYLLKSLRKEYNNFETYSKIPGKLLNLGGLVVLTHFFGLPMEMAEIISSILLSAVIPAKKSNWLIKEFIKMYSEHKDFVENDKIWKEIAN